MSSPFNPDFEYSSEETIALTDELGRSLECYVEHSLEVDGLVYLLLMPVDIPITIISWENEAPGESTLEEAEVEAVMLEDDAEITEIFANARAVLAEQNLSLKHTAHTLTAVGELPPIEEEQILTLDMGEGEADEDDDLDTEELQLLASFYYSDRHYSIYTPLTPLLFFARYDDRRDRLDLVSPEEEGFQPILEELLFEELEDN